MLLHGNERGMRYIVRRATETCSYSGSAFATCWTSGSAYSFFADVWDDVPLWVAPQSESVVPTQCGAPPTCFPWAAAVWSTVTTSIGRHTAIDLVCCAGRIDGSTFIESYVPLLGVDAVTAAPATHSNPLAEHGRKEPGSATSASGGAALERSACTVVDGVSGGSSAIPAAEVAVDAVLLPRVEPAALRPTETYDRATTGGGIDA